MAEKLKEHETASGDADARAAELAAFDREIEQDALQGHWKMELPANLEPRSKLQPMHWKGSLIREQLLRARLFRGNVHAARVLGAHQLHEHHLRSIEVIAQVHEQNPFTNSFGRRRRGRAC